MRTLTNLEEICSRVREFIESGKGDFNSLALDVFRFQFENNAPYRSYCESLRIDPAGVSSFAEAPPVVTSAFKDLELSALPHPLRSAVFHSSGTTQQRPSRHFHSATTLRLYETALCRWFEPHLLPGASEASFLVLTPRAEQLPHSSLIHMFETVASRFCGASRFVADLVEDGGWTINFAALEAALADLSAIGKPVILCGTAFSFVHLSDYLLQRKSRLGLPRGSRVFETGGYKGRSRSVPKPELHSIITKLTGIPDAYIVSEYGMSELSSQAYDQIAGQFSQRVFRFPPWVRAQVISPEHGREVQDGETGLLRIYDLANVGSVMAIQTEDLAIRRGSGFELLGRAALAEPRGCSLMQIGS